MSLTFRPADPSMLDELRQVDVAAWGEEMAATLKMLETRMWTNPTGNYVAIHKESGRIAGSVWTLWIDDISYPTWQEGTGNGVYEGVFNPFGEVMFGANISVDRTVTVEDAVGPFLLQRVASIVPAMGRRYARMGGRIPSYHEWASLFRAEDYIWLFRGRGKVYFLNMETGKYHDGDFLPTLIAQKKIAVGQVDPRNWPVASAPPDELSPFDPWISFFTTTPIRGKCFRVVRTLPGYFPDPESCDYGVLFEWENPERAG